MVDLAGNLDHIHNFSLIEKIMRNLEAIFTNTIELLGVDGVTNLSTIARACPVRPSKAHTDLMRREHGMVDKANTI